LASSCQYQLLKKRLLITFAPNVSHRTEKYSAGKMPRSDPLTVDRHSALHHPVYEAEEKKEDSKRAQMYVFKWFWTNWIKN
jgi:hypothetical protein